jgi:hypothetical protein
MGAIVIRTRFDEGTESAEVATSVMATADHRCLTSFSVAILELIRGAQCLIEVIRSSGEEM